MSREGQVSAGGVYDLGLHVVWCAKYRRPVLTDAVADRLRELIDAKAAEHDWRIVACEVMPDHVHLFVKTRPQDSPSFVANQFKGFTSRMLCRSAGTPTGPVAGACVTATSRPN